MFRPPGHIPLLDAVDAVAVDHDREGLEAARAERAASQKREATLSLTPPGPVMDPHASFFELRAMVAKSRVIACRAERARETARNELCQALGVGSLSAIGIDPVGNIRTIQAEPWRTEAGFAALESGVLVFFPPSESIHQTLTVFLPDLAFEKWRGRPHEPPTIASEKRLVDILAAMMSANPGTPRSKQKVKKDPGISALLVSDRAFERAWQAALEQSGAAAWRRPGPRKKITALISALISSAT